MEKKYIEYIMEEIEYKMIQEHKENCVMLSFEDG